jgi:hypothetical protein
MRLVGGLMGLCGNGRIILELEMDWIWMGFGEWSRSRLEELEQMGQGEKILEKCINE